jgi:hypothetical protein
MVFDVKSSLERIKEVESQMFDEEPEEIIAEENETDGQLRCPMCNQPLGPMKP